MGEINKLNCIQQAGYAEEVRNATMNFLHNYEQYHDTEDYDEEKSYMQAVSASVSHMGKWCLSLQKPAEEEESKLDPFSEPNSRQFFTQVSQFLLEKAIYILDTDCLEVGWPMIDFLTPWIQSHFKLDELPPGVGESILQILNIVLKRIGYPTWCDIDVEADDLQVDY